MNWKMYVCKQTVMVYERFMKFTLGKGGHIVVVQRPPQRGTSRLRAGNKSLLCTPRHDFVKATKKFLNFSMGTHRAQAQSAHP